MSPTEATNLASFGNASSVSGLPPSPPVVPTSPNPYAYASEHVFAPQPGAGDNRGQVQFMNKTTTFDPRNPEAVRQLELWRDPERPKTSPRWRTLVTRAGCPSAARWRACREGLNARCEDLAKVRCLYHLTNAPKQRLGNMNGHNSVIVRRHEP